MSRLCGKPVPQVPTIFSLQICRFFAGKFLLTITFIWDTLILPLILFTSVQDNWECPHLEICSYGSVQSIVNCIVKQSSSGTYGVSSDITIPFVNLFIRFQSLLEFIVFAKHEMIKVPNLVQSAQLPRFSCYIELTVVDPLQKITDTRDGVSDQT